MPLFFVSCPLDFEAELQEEIKGFWFEMIDLDGLPTRSSFPEAEVFRGGIQFSTELHLGLQINFFSKLANRVLLRAEKFEARYYDQFEKGLSKIDFGKYFPGADLKLKIEHHKSRLNNEKNLQEAAANALKKSKFRISDESPNTVFIRIEKDLVILSLDTSGEHLHRRGYAAFRGEAPLRETLAAGMVRRLEKQVPLDENLTLIDPFAGSGTLLFEACSRHLPNFERSYAWLGFVNAPKLFRSETWKKNYRWIQAGASPQMLAFDIDEKAIANIERNQLEYRRLFNQEAAIEAFRTDGRDLDLRKYQLRKKVWCICNPPYGIRMADDQARGVLEHLEKDLDGLLLIHPADWEFNFESLRRVSGDEFRNQGLNLKLSVFVKKANDPALKFSRK